MNGIYAYIEYCSQCPHCWDYDPNYPADIRCAHKVVGERKLTGKEANANEIPAWCPLRIPKESDYDCHECYYDFTEDTEVCDNCSVKSREIRFKARET